MFQNVTSEAVAGLDGVLNISDDILIGTDHKTHEAKLHAVLKRLEDKGITLNAKKCQFRAQSQKFNGFIFSGNEISAEPSKVAAIKEVSPPQMRCGHYLA